MLVSESTNACCILSDKYHELNDVHAMLTEGVTVWNRISYR